MSVEQRFTDDEPNGWLAAGSLGLAVGLYIYLQVLGAAYDEQRHLVNAVRFYINPAGEDAVVVESKIPHHISHLDVGTQFLNEQGCKILSIDDSDAPETRSVVVDPNCVSTLRDRQVVRKFFAGS